jgi:polysaccharide biosynthesis protein PslE
VGFEGWMQGRNRGAPADAPARLRLGRAEVMLELWRSRVLIALVFLVFSGAGLVIAWGMPGTHVATIRLLVIPQVSDPTGVSGGDMTKMQPAEPDGRLRAEAELVRSPVVAGRALDEVGLARIYPGLEARHAASGPGDAIALGERALDAFADDLKVTTAPGSTILQLSFDGRDPTLAAEVLDALVAHYLEYRREVLGGPGSVDLARPREAAEKRLAEAEDALQAFLSRQDIPDFEVELAGTIRLRDLLAEELVKVQADRRETVGEATGLRARLKNPPPQGPVHPEEIESLRPNERVEARLADVGVAAEAKSSRLAELTRQKAETEARLARLLLVEPDYRRLVRERDAIRSSAEALARNAETERARADLAAAGQRDITVYQSPRVAPSDNGLRMAIPVAGVVLGLLAAMLAGLMRVCTAQAFSTPSTVERSLGLPVLAHSPERRG